MIPIMIVGEVDLVRSALVAVLAREGDLEVVGERSPQQDLVAAVQEHHPAVVVMDIDIDRYGVDGFDSAQSLADQVPQCRVLVVADRLTAVLVRRALAAGVWGIAGPDTSPEQLAQAIRQVAAGERAIGPALAALALQPVENPLSDKQRVVLALAGEGLPAREIARRLFLSPGTVRNYLSVAMTKTGARNRLDAVRRAREEGWL